MGTFTDADLETPPVTPKVSFAEPAAPKELENAPEEPNDGDLEEQPESEEPAIEKPKSDEVPEEEQQPGAQETPAAIQLNDPVNNTIAVPEKPIAEEPQPEPETVDATVVANPAAKKTWSCKLCHQHLTEQQIIDGVFEGAWEGHSRECKNIQNRVPSVAKHYTPVVQRRLASHRRRLENRPIHMLAKLIQQAQA